MTLSKKLALQAHYCQALTIDDVKDVLSLDTEIASARCRDGKRKRFKFNTWRNEYTVLKGEDVVDSGQALEELINIYNELT